LILKACFISASNRSSALVGAVTRARAEQPVLNLWPFALRDGLQPAHRRKALAPTET